MPELKKMEIFPCSIRPGLIDRLLGVPVFIIDQDGFTCTTNRAEAKFSFAELAELSVNEQNLELVKNDGQKCCFRLPGNAEATGAAFKMLYQEYVSMQNNLRRLLQMSGEEKFACFKKCFELTGAPYVRAVEMLLAIAAAEKISDFHFEPMKDGVKATWRHQGKVSLSGVLDHENYQRLLARVKFLAGCRSHVNDQAQEGAFRDEPGQIDVRVSCFPTDIGERLSLRFIQPCHYQRLDLLGWSAEVLSCWREMLAAGSGLYIISGPVGSGKTTALYATLAELAQNDAQLRVVTIEDPVEGRIDSICQSSLDSMRNLSLAQAFKHLLRQDPDIIALGEIRDRDCLKEALQAGLSGHRVLATFHAGREGETLARIRQMGLEDYLVMQGLRGIISLELEFKGGKPCASAKIVPVIARAET